MILHWLCHFLRAELLIFNLRALLVFRRKNLNSGSSSHAAAVKPFATKKSRIDKTLGDNSVRPPTDDIVSSWACVHQCVCSKLCRSKQATAAWIAEFRWHCTLLVVMLVVIDYEAVACHSMFTRRQEIFFVCCKLFCTCWQCVIVCVLRFMTMNS